MFKLMLCFSASLSSDTHCGGPSQAELLEQLQNCEISASRVSSAVSSRAPSPSPSLMSIMFPGMKPAPSSVQAGTPTAIIRNLSGLSTNLFQPIRRNSTSGSNLSLSATANPTLQASTSFSLQVPGGRAGGDRSGVERADIACQTDPMGVENTEQHKETERSSLGSGVPVARSSSDGAELGLSKIRRPKAQWSASLVHQRSRSNEIDYSSSGVSGSRPNSTTFQSVPGSCGNVRAFRPVSVGSTQTGCSALSDPFPSASTESRVSSKTLLNDSGRTLTPSPRTEDNGYPITRVASDGHSTSYWSREFATMSDYFGGGDNHIEVTDC